MQTESFVTAPTPIDKRNASPRERILAAARHLYYWQGIRGVGVDEIAEVASSNKVTLYRHFGSKAGLIQEYLRECADDFEERWDAIARLHQGHPVEQLIAFIDYYADFFLSDGGRGCALANAAVELAARDDPARPLIEEKKAEQWNRLVSLCHMTGYADPDILADELFLLIEGARVCMQSMGPSGPASRLKALARNTISSHETG